MANTWKVPRLLQRKNLPITQETLSLDHVLSKFVQTSPLTVKHSSHRFFMYEEHAPTNKLFDSQVTKTVSLLPNEFSTKLNLSDTKRYYYWTSPLTNVAPSLVSEFDWHQNLFSKEDETFLDPRGPSLWMGSSGSGTQCHYDVANNIIVQLYGTKRIRCYPPSTGITNFHVYPDAHPRARKSQVDLDNPDLKRFPLYSDIHPIIDIILEPGDALEIPAFWFHHVENGKLPSSNKNLSCGQDGPSMSLNCFALSKPMMIAQQIFQKASLQRITTLIRQTQEKSPTLLLKSLGVSLIQGLGIISQGEERDFIQKALLKARYEPLEEYRDILNYQSSSLHSQINPELSEEDLKLARKCVEGILPEFELLLESEEKEENKERIGDANGIAMLVALHLLELWAVELVGAPLVAKSWKEALRE